MTLLIKVKFLSIPFSKCSGSFLNFLIGLGWPIDPSTHSGYTGGLDLKNLNCGPCVLYYSDFLYQIIFHVSNLLPLDPPGSQQISRKRHIGNDHIHIIWCENSQEYDISTITSQFNQAHIIVYPLQTGLFRVEVFWKDDLDWFGPIRFSTVVSKLSLPFLLRQTSVSAMIAYYRKTTPLQYPELEVNEQISILSKNFLSDLAENPLISMMTQ